MRKYLIIIASFIIMLCLGGVYAWSIIASDLIEKHGFSTAQTQIIFGTVIAVFPVTMIFAGKMAKRMSPKILTAFSAIFFSGGYLTAGISDGHFFWVFLGAGIFAGIGTGFGYLMSLTIPVKWFPGRKGLVTGIAAAGFGLGAIVLSALAEFVLQMDKDIFYLFRVIGIVYGAVILLFSLPMAQPALNPDYKEAGKTETLTSKLFLKLFSGMFLGTFSGLLIIGSLKIIGGQNEISNQVLVLGVSLFAVSNFSGRLFWGFLSDYTSATLNIFAALTLQAIGIFFLGYTELGGFSYLLFSVVTGFGFGGNFVLFAKETANIYGVGNLGIIYPYVFIGYAIAGIAGPLTGGLLSDFYGNYTNAVLLASAISLAGGLLFLFHHFQSGKTYAGDD